MYSFSIGAESNPGTWYCRKEYITEKSSDTIGNRSRNSPTSSAAPYTLRHTRPLTKYTKYINIFNIYILTILIYYIYFVRGPGVA